MSPTQSLRKGWRRNKKAVIAASLAGAAGVGLGKSLKDRKADQNWDRGKQRAKNALITGTGGAFLGSLLSSGKSGHLGARIGGSIGAIAGLLNDPKKKGSRTAETIASGGDWNFSQGRRRKAEGGSLTQFASASPLFRRVGKITIVGKAREGLLESSDRMARLALRQPAMNGIATLLTKVDGTTRGAVQDKIRGRLRMFIGGTVATGRKGQRAYVNRAAIERGNRDLFKGAHGGLREIAHHEALHTVPVIGKSEILAHAWGGLKSRKGTLSPGAAVHSVKHLWNTRPSRLVGEAGTVAAGSLVAAKALKGEKDKPHQFAERDRLEKARDLALIGTAAGGGLLLAKHLPGMAENLRQATAIARKGGALLEHGEAGLKKTVEAGREGFRSAATSPSTIPRWKRTFVKAIGKPGRAVMKAVGLSDPSALRLPPSAFSFAEDRRTPERRWNDRLDLAKAGIGVAGGVGSLLLLRKAGRAVKNLEPWAKEQWEKQVVPALGDVRKTATAWRHTAQSVNKNVAMIGERAKHPLFPNMTKVKGKAKAQAGKRKAEAVPAPAAAAPAVAPVAEAAPVEKGNGFVSRVKEAGSKLKEYLWHDPRPATAFSRAGGQRSAVRGPRFRPSAFRLPPSAFAALTAFARGDMAARVFTNNTSGDMAAQRANPATLSDEGKRLRRDAALELRRLRNYYGNTNAMLKDADRFRKIRAASEETAKALKRAGRVRLGLMAGAAGLAGYAGYRMLKKKKPQPESGTSSFSRPSAFRLPPSAFAALTAFARGDYLDEQGRHASAWDVLTGKKQAYNTVFNPATGRHEVDLRSPREASLLDAAGAAHAKAKTAARWGGRTTGLVRDAGDALAGRERRRDASGRTVKREWEKPWFSRHAKEALATAALIGGGLVLRRSPRAMDLLGKGRATAEGYLKKAGDWLDDRLGPKNTAGLKVVPKVKTEPSRAFVTSSPQGRRTIKEVEVAVKKKQGRNANRPLKTGQYYASPPPVDPYPQIGYPEMTRRMSAAIEGLLNFSTSQPLNHFDEAADMAGWDLRDPRGRSARVFAPGAGKRERREKYWHEKVDNERKLWAAGALLAGGTGVAAARKLLPRTVEKVSEKVVPVVLPKAESFTLWGGVKARSRAPRVPSKPRSGLSIYRGKEPKEKRHYGPMLKGKEYNADVAASDPRPLLHFSTSQLLNFSTAAPKRKAEGTESAPLSPIKKGIAIGAGGAAAATGAGLLLGTRGGRDLVRRSLNWVDRKALGQETLDAVKSNVAKQNARTIGGFKVDKMSKESPLLKLPKRKGILPQGPPERGIRAALGSWVKRQKRKLVRKIDASGADDVGMSARGPAHSFALREAVEKLGREASRFVGDVSGSSVKRAQAELTRRKGHLADFRGLVDRIESGQAMPRRWSRIPGMPGTLEKARIKRMRQASGQVLQAEQRQNRARDLVKATGAAAGSGAVAGYAVGRSRREDDRLKS